MVNPHVLVIAYPAQGHVIPLMELALSLAKHGLKVTFVNTEFNHERVIKSLSETDDVRELIHMVSIPDGLDSSDDRSDMAKLWESTIQVMPGELKALIERLNNGKKESEKVSCLISDSTVGWAMDVAEEMGLKKVVFWPAAAALLVQLLRVPSLIHDGIIDELDGRAMKDESIKLSPTMPVMKTTEFFWMCITGETLQERLFRFFFKLVRPIKLADRYVCNSSTWLEPGTFASYPELTPIGPLLASNRHGKSSGHFWQEDSGCLTWLDRQPAKSVIYVAFGSITIFDQEQFEEVALGLELTNRPFLWVVRQDITGNVNNAFPAGFKERVKDRGLIVSWAPQQKVLSHPSLGCFVSHCGWNSTVEGVSNGVPFLCWPYFTDQIYNKSYICDSLKIGLELNKDESGIIRQKEIKDKLERLLGDEELKERVLDLQEKVLNGAKEGGSSYKNFVDFLAWIKE